MSFCIYIYAQTTRNAVVSFRMSDFSIANMDGLTRISVLERPSVYSEDTLKPAIPYVGVNILIGRNDTYKEFSFTKEEEFVQSEVIMAQNEVPTPTDIVPRAYISLLPVYTQDNYPSKTVEYTGTHIINGYKFVSFSVSPFRYDATNKKLYLNKEIKIDVSVVPSSPVEIKHVSVSPVLSRSSSVRQDVLNLIENKTDMISLYGSLAQNSSNRSQSDTVPYKYLIITNNELCPEFNRLAKWKTIKGVKAKVLTVEEIDSIFIGNTRLDK